jgi:hypothetical protein
MNPDSEEEKRPPASRAEGAQATKCRSAYTSGNAASWFKAVRSDEATELLRRAPKAFLLAYVIAFRARWKNGFSFDGLQQGEAMLGDHDECGMTEREYRTAKKQLQKWNFATFKTTNRGTLGKLTDTRLFSVLNFPNDEQNDEQATDSRRATDERLTTNVEGIEGIEVDGGSGPVVLPQGFPATADEAKVAAMFVGCSDDVAEKVWNKAMSRRGRDAKDNAIRSWRHYLAAEWAYERDRQAQGESRTNGQPQGAASPSELILRQKELDRVEKRISTLRNKYPDGIAWEQKDKDEIKKLRSRKAELLQILGMTV